jgi:low temperature requirement protein LtrA
MANDIDELDADLRRELRHRLRPLTGLVKSGANRPVAPLELLYDLTYVIAFGAAAEELTAAIVAGHTDSGVGAYLFVIFAVGWAWLNFTWYSSAYGNDDALFRVATIVQMIGVLMLVFGLPQHCRGTQSAQRGDCRRIRCYAGAPHRALAACGPQR